MQSIKDEIFVSNYSTSDSRTIPPSRSAIHLPLHKGGETASEETAVQKEHKKEEIRRISTLKMKKSIKFERRNRRLTESSLFLGSA